MVKHACRVPMGMKYAAAAVVDAGSYGTLVRLLGILTEVRRKMLGCEAYGVCQYDDCILYTGSKW